MDTSIYKGHLLPLTNLRGPMVSRLVGFHSHLLPRRLVAILVFRLVLGEVLEGEILLGDGGAWREGEGERCDRCCLDSSCATSFPSPPPSSGSSMTARGREYVPDSRLLEPDRRCGVTSVPVSGSGIPVPPISISISTVLGVVGTDLDPPFSAPPSTSPGGREISSPSNDMVGGLDRRLGGIVFFLRDCCLVTTSSVGMATIVPGLTLLPV